MAEWKQTLEPYIKVTERIKTTTLNPTAGEDLIIGVVIISDAGSSKPTLIAGQDEFLSNYASRNISQDYINSLNDLYTGEDKTTAATMWSNAYRLAGSNTLLVVRASKSDNTYFSKPLAKSDLNTYLLRDGELLKKVSSFKIVKDTTGDLGYESSNGWAICISGVGIIGNLTTDAGPQYDYLATSIPELVEKLNDTTKFFSPSYKFYTTPETEGKEPVSAETPGIVSVVFDEVYLGTGLLDKTDPRLNPVSGSGSNEGKVNLITCLPDWASETETQKVIDLNSDSYSGFTPTKYYATNVYNSASNLRVRIRRFNHDAVVSKTIPDTTSLTENGESPYTVLTQVLDTFTKKGTVEPAASILARDFYEVAILDPGVNDVVSYFNIGNILGRGDMEVSELNSLLTMMQLQLPDNMRDLDINYYGYEADDARWVKLENFTPETGVNYPHVATVEALDNLVGVEIGTIYRVGGDTPAAEDKYYILTSNSLNSQIFANLTVDPSETKIISVDDSDLKKALDQIVLNEVYTVEGLSDLGNTSLGFQSYMANTAIGDNYFYPVSTVNSINYMAIGNSISKLSQDSCKLYTSAPWDIDTGTLGWKYYAAPSVMYWETVARNRRNNNEFAGVFGQSNGIAQYQRPTCEFNKKQRQLLLSKRVNTVMWNTSTQAWNMNDNYTKQNEDNILSDDGNSRLCIRISKAIPTLLRQFIGKKISEKLCTDVRGVIDYFFKTTILPMNYTCEAYQITCNYDEALARQNKIKVIVEVRYFRSLKFVEVYNNAFDVGMDFTGQE